MTEKQWLDEYDKRLPNFQWFIQKYFKPALLQEMAFQREQGKWGRLMSLLNSIWFHLPDNKFNIIENPKGWSDLLFLVENPPGTMEIPNPN